MARVAGYGGHGEIVTEHSRRAGLGLLLFTAAFFVLHVVFQSGPWNDELTYQTAAEDMLSRIICAPGIATVQIPPCNPQHPPLAKALFAASMGVLGTSLQNARLVSFVLGAATIPLVAFIAWKLTRRPEVAVLAGVLTGIDPLFYYMSSFAMLDVTEVFFTVAAFAIYLSDLRMRKTLKLAAVGAVMGLSFLSKEVAIFALGALLTYHLLFSGGPRSKRVEGALVVAASAGFTIAAGLQLYDSLFTTFPSFLNHLQYIVSFGEQLTNPNPLLSVFYASPYIWFVPAYVPRFSPPLDVFVSALVFLWIPVALLTMRSRGSESSKPYVFSLVWLLWVYVPFLCLYSFGRSEYYYYATQVVPPLVLGGSYFLSSARGLPRWFPALYLVPCVAWLLLFFLLGTMGVGLHSAVCFPHVHCFS